MPLLTAGDRHHIFTRKHHRLVCEVDFAVLLARARRVERQIMEAACEVLLIILGASAILDVSGAGDFDRIKNLRFFDGRRFLIMNCVPP